MSGPKSGNWRLVPCPSAEEGRRRSRHAIEQLHYYLRCILQFREKLAALQRRHPELQLHTSVDDIVDPGETEAAEICRELNNRYEIYIRLRDELERAEELAERAARLAEEQAAMAAMVESILKGRRTEARERADAAVEHLRNLRDKAQKVWASVDARTAPERRRELDAAVAACLEAADPDAAELRLTELRVHVRRANRETGAERRRVAEQRAAGSRAARQILSRLDDAQAEIDASLRDSLLEACGGETDYSAGLRACAESAASAAERHYAGEVLRRTLEGLGYEVHQGFETLFEAGGSAYFQRASWDKHYVKVMASGEHTGLAFRLARYGEESEPSAEQALRDREMEEQWCGEVPNLLQDLSARGLAVELTRRVAPGAVPVEVVSDERLKPASRRKKKKQAREQERYLS